MLGDECTLKVSSISSSGEGIGTYHGLKIFIDGSLPGEEVVVKITQCKKNYAVGQLLTILNPSPERTEPLCPLFGACGGCQIMHLQYTAQLKLKQTKVKDALQRIGGLSCEPLPCCPSPFSLGYRSKVVLPLVWDRGKKTLGFYRKQSHEIIPLKRCLIQCPQGEEILNYLSEKLTIPTVRHVLIRNALFSDEALVVFVSTGKFSKELKQFAHEMIEANSSIKGVVENINLREDNVILGQNFRLLAGRPYIYERLLGMTFKISPSAFFQINPAQAEKMYEKAVELAEIKKSEHVVDAFCGVGALAILAAPHARSVHGIECVPHAVADAIENARLNRLQNCTFTCGHAEKLLDQHRRADVVF